MQRLYFNKPMSGEIRQNKATKEWVIYAPARGKRPHDFQQAQQHGRPALPPHDSRCPFCPGNEHMLPDVLHESPDAGGDGWQTRIVPNKYPALTPDGSITRYTDGMYVAMQGYGHHAVIIESPRHDQDLATLPVAAVATVIETYHRRYVELQTDARNVLILIFRNHGARAGASLSHPHSQLISTGMIPRHLRMREEEAQSYFDEWGRCVFCDIVAFEQHDRRRVLLENESFVAFVPFAAEVPFETWIVPRRHQSDFGLTTETERADLADALHGLLARLHTRLNDPDYNYVVNSTPRAGEPHLHWFVRVRPRLITRAGFEIGSGIRINPSLPEADAAFLNETIDSAQEE
jgi:UDPglucose--hexose-1-phosphate uridylyltransferase